MSSTINFGRVDEVEEIVKYARAAEVGRLLLGELNRPIKLIISEQYLDKPRRELKQIRESVRTDLRGEISKFCRQNFENLELKDLIRLYVPLLAHDSLWRLPLTEFIQQFGRPKEGVLKGAPLHSTIVLSPWGLQTEYPEMHLIKDLAVAFNAVIAIENELDQHKRTPWSKVKNDETRERIADLQRRGAFHRRMCLLSCFNLAEAYINGLAWGYVQTRNISSLSNVKQKILTEGQASILDKLVKIPQIVADQSPGPLDQEHDPLRTFKETIKPFRDSIVHASPFAAPERFGGYEKLSKLYGEHSVINYSHTTRHPPGDKLAGLLNNAP
jgi:hypothetical protein